MRFLSTPFQEWEEGRVIANRPGRGLRMRFLSTQLSREQV